MNEPLYETNEEIDTGRKSAEQTAICSTLVMKLIAQCAASKNVFMDLSNKELQEIPELLLGLEHIEYLYLQDNKIEVLPENFFSSFPNLRWLDLRNNSLTSLKMTDIGTHRHLHTLLLSENKIRKLPLDLGRVISLKALNIGENQVNFPPAEVVGKGVAEILNFLQNTLIKMAQDEQNQNEHILEENGNTRKESSSAYSTTDQQSMSSYTPGYDSLVHSHSTPLAHGQSFDEKLLRYDPLSLDNGAGDYSDAMVPKVQISQSATLHKPMAYYQIRQQYLERARLPGGEHKSIARTQSERHNELVHRYPEPPALDIIERNMLDERRKKRMRDVNDKQDAILQRRRDQESIKVWRDESKKKQRVKYFDQMKKGTSQIKFESETRMEDAPFGVKRDEMQVLRPEDLAQMKLANLREDDKPQPLSPETLAALEAQRRTEEKQLEGRIRNHAMDMRDRNKGPKKTAKEDLEAAQRDMQIAQQLHKEIVRHRDVIQHHIDGNFGTGPIRIDAHGTFSS